MLISRLVRCGGATLAAALLLTGCGKRAGTADVAAAPPPAVEETARAEQAKPLPRLVDLGAHSCIPCKMMAPVLAELAKEYEGRMTVEFIDVWENPERGKEYGVESIPTQIFYGADGKELFRHVGFLSKEDILAEWKELGYSFAPEKDAE